jgi:hypothetical protein
MEPEGSGARRSQIYFVFFFSTQKRRRETTHIEHFAKAQRAIAKTKALQRVQ